MRRNVVRFSNKRVACVCMFVFMCVCMYIHCKSIYCTCKCEAASKVIFSPQCNRSVNQSSEQCRGHLKRSWEPTTVLSAVSTPSIHPQCRCKCVVVNCGLLCTILFDLFYSRIQYKLSSLCYNCLNSTAPDYLTELL